ncbi:MAG: hypothetical protein AAB414_04655 [Patescibacteria group bacterium]
MDQDELSPRQVLEMQIRQRLGNLHELSREATKAQAFDYHTAFADREVQPVTLPQKTFAGFLNHSICGGSIGPVWASYTETQFKGQPVDKELIDRFQQQTVSLLSLWSNDSERSHDPLEQEICLGLLKVSQSFHWASDLTNFQRLHEITGVIAKDLAAYSGRPLGRQFSK